MSTGASLGRAPLCWMPDRPTRIGTDPLRTHHLYVQERSAEEP
jgi:hypothetical protein